MRWSAPLWFATFASLLLPRFALAESAPVPPPPECWNGPRDYYPEGEGATGGVRQVEERLSVDRVTRALPEPMVVSPNGAYAYHLDVTPSGPSSGASRGELLVFAERPYLGRLGGGGVFKAVRDHWVSGRGLVFRSALGGAP